MDIAGACPELDESSGESDVEGEPPGLVESSGESEGESEGPKPKTKKKPKLPRPDNVLLCMRKSEDETEDPQARYGGLCPGCEDEYDQHLPSCRKFGRNGRYKFLATEMFEQQVAQ